MSAPASSETNSTPATGYVHSVWLLLGPDSRCCPSLCDGDTSSRARLHSTRHAAFLRLNECWKMRNHVSILSILPPAL